MIRRTQQDWRMKMRNRNPGKDEYEVQRGSSHAGGMLFVGNRETTAVEAARDLLRSNPAFADENHLRLYHTHPSPGPVRRYVGTVRDDGTGAINLHRAV